MTCAGQSEKLKYDAILKEESVWRRVFFEKLLLTYV